MNTTTECPGCHKAMEGFIAGYECVHCKRYWKIQNNRLVEVASSAETRPAREHLHMLTAMSWSKRSLCKRLSVGVVITNWDMDQIHAFGYNGPGKRLPNDRCRGSEGSCGCLHSEQNAVAKIRVADQTMVAFLTHTPCELCAQLLANAGVRRVVYGALYRDISGRDLLSSLGVLAERIPDPIMASLEKLLS